MSVDKNSEDKERKLEEENEKSSNYLISYTRHLERRLRNLDATKSKLERELLSSQRDLANLRQELDRLRQPPLISATITDILPDNRAVVKSSSGPSFVVKVAQKVNVDSLNINDRVALNQRTFAVMENLPSVIDPLVQVMEIKDTPPEITYGDIGGLKDQLQEVRETVELPLINPDIFKKVGVDPPKGILLFGKPGTGKTLMAKAVANATNASFIRIIGSELVQKFIGEGARMVRELFQMARDKAPAILFIDELDAIGSKRIKVATSGDREVQRTLMQLLSELDGFNNRGDIRVIAATNRPDILDPALLRPGRFDRLIEFPAPNENARVQIFKIHTSHMNLSDEAKQFKKFLKATEGASGADIKAICTEAGMFAIRRESEVISEGDIRKAITKVRKNAKKTTDRFKLYA